jgi:hypothetical protein
MKEAAAMDRRRVTIAFFFALVGVIFFTFTAPSYGAHSISLGITHEYGSAPAERHDIAPRSSMDHHQHAGASLWLPWKAGLLSPAFFVIIEWLNPNEPLKGGHPPSDNRDEFPRPWLEDIGWPDQPSR